MRFSGEKQVKECKGRQSLGKAQNVGEVGIDFYDKTAICLQIRRVRLSGRTLLCKS
jgi:hypothetical protein